eukprot:gene28124-31770_t
MKVDKTDCANGCTVTSGTFANALNFIEFGPRRDQVDLLGINPGAEWKITPKLVLDVAGNYNRSRFTHEAPTVMPMTAPNSGNTITYANNGGVPSIESNLDLKNPASYQWIGGRVNIQNELRQTETKGFHTNLAWGDKKLTVKGGFAWDDIDRQIRAQDNSAAWQAAVCGNNPTVFLQGPNGAPPCNGASTPGASAAALYPGYGTGYTAGQSAPLTYQGSLITNAALPGYLVPGPYGAGAGYLREKSKAVYMEASGELAPAGFTTRWNAGVRYVRTNQQRTALEVARSAVECFTGLGVYGVEMFLLHDDSVLVNEIAPRPHNSGHYTIEACEVDQFEMHLRAILGLPCPPPRMKVGASIMLNVLGKETMEQTKGVLQRALAVPGAAIHWYGKLENRPGRKMAHITITADDHVELRKRAEKLDIPALLLQGLPVAGPRVGVIMGSDSDLSVMQDAAKPLPDDKVQGFMSQA